MGGLCILALYGARSEFSMARFIRSILWHSVFWLSDTHTSYLAKYARPTQKIQKQKNMSKTKMMWQNHGV